MDSVKTNIHYTLLHCIVSKRKLRIVRTLNNQKKEKLYFVFHNLKKLTFL